MSVSASLNVVLQVPVQYAIMRRELGSKLYTPVNSFMARLSSNMIIQIIYPMIIIGMIFWAVNLNATLDNLLLTISYAVMASFVFCAQGYVIGTFAEDAILAFTINLVGILILFATSGVLANVNNSNPVAAFLIKISPARLLCEGIFRRVTSNVDTQFSVESAE